MTVWKYKITVIKSNDSKTEEELKKGLSKIEENWCELSLWMKKLE